MEQIEFNLQDFCINAGIVGLIKMLEEQEDDTVYEIERSTLKVDKDFLLNTDLTNLYFKTLINKYQNICQLIRIEEKLKNICVKELEQKEVKVIIKEIEASLSSNRYKKGYEIVKEKLSFNFYEDLKELKSENTGSYQEKAEKVLNDLKNNELREIFLIKDLAYYVIKYFWKGVCFLNRQNSAKDPKEEFKAYFENPLKEYLQKEIKGEEYCCECGRNIKGSSKMRTSYVITLTEDFSRKNSNYWNFKPNCFVCPLCNFLFALLPLGFSSYNRAFIFINQNTSVKTLDLINNDIFADNELNAYQKFNEMINKITEKNLKQLSNIEVITNMKEQEKYDFNIISKTVLLKIKYNDKRLKSLSKKSSIKIRDEYLNIYEEVMYRILNNYQQYPLIDRLILLSLNDEYKYASASCMTILKIEGGNKMDYENIKEIGAKYSKDFIDARKKELVFQMLDMIKAEDGNGLFNLIANLSNISGELIPEELYEILTDNDKLKLIGYAFVIGFRNGVGKDE